MRSATGTVLFHGAFFGGKAYTFGFIMMRESKPENFSSFGAKLGHQKVKQLPKNDLSTSFWTHRSSLGRFYFLGEKFPANPNIQDVLEIIQEYLSIELSWAQCG